MAATRRITAKEAARRLHRAKRDLDAARRALAAAPRGRRSPPQVFAGEWHVANAALESGRAALSRIPGVVGHGLGHRIRGGVETDELCVAVFVRKKRQPEHLKREGLRRVPRSLAHGRRRVPTDVVELAPLRKQEDGARPSGPSSIAFPHTGEAGTIGALGIDLDSGRPAVLTAMHVAGGGELDITLAEAQADPEREATSPVGGPVVGRLVRGTTTGVDAAKVVLDGAIDLSTLPRVVGSRPASEDDDTAVELYGAASHRILNGAVKYVNFNLDYGGESLENAILAVIPTIAGDSGAGLVDDTGCLLGILYGMAPLTLNLPPPTLPRDVRVFSAVETVLSTLRFALPRKGET